MVKPVRLHLLPLAVAAILVVTAVPVDVGMGLLWTRWPTAGDFVANLLLFLPLGAALARRRLLVVLAVSFALSGTIEVVQHWSIDRFSSPFDVIANTLSGLAGAVLWKALRKSGQDPVVTLRPITHAGLAMSCVAVAAAWFQPGVSSAVTGWDPSYALLLGDERTGQRSWKGVIDAVALVPEALQGRAATQLSTTPPAQWRDVIPRAALLDTNRHALDGNTAVHLSQETADDFAARATAANAFTLAARIKPASLRQSGPARILSFSWDPYHRNVDLGQERDRLVFRVRTPISGENGARVRVQSAGVLQDRTMTLVASYDGAISRLYVDGKLAARRNLAAAGCQVRVLCDGGAHLAWSVFGASAVALTVAMIGALAPWTLWGVGIGSGAWLGAIVVSLADDARIVPAPWTAALPLAGGLAVVLAIRMATKVGSVSAKARPAP